MSPSTPSSPLPARPAPPRLRICAPPTTPVVLSVPHAGISTAGFADELVPGLDVRCDADLLVDALYEVADGDSGAWGGPYVVARLSRFVCDMNLDADDV